MPKPVFMTIILFLFGTLASFAGGTVDQQTISKTIKILEQKFVGDNRNKSAAQNAQRQMKSIEHSRKGNPKRH